MKAAVLAEWTKIRTIRSSVWLALAVIVVTVGISAASAAAVRCSAVGCHQDSTKIALTGVTAGQAVVAVLGVLVISDEYRAGMMATTLAATPRRLVAFAAKAAILSGVVFVTAVPSVLGALLAARFALLRNGFTAAHGFSPLSLSDGTTGRAAIGSVLYLALVALLSFGISTAVRDAAVAIGVVLGLLYLFPVLAAVVSDPVWQRHLEQIGPMSAGLAVQSTIDLSTLPVGPWTGLAILAGWAGGGLLVGWISLRSRDA